MNGRVRVVNIDVSVTTEDEVVSRVFVWAGQRESRYICFATVHMVMEAGEDKELSEAVRRADICAPDGMPLVWNLRFHGMSSAKRVYGPDVMTRVLREAAGKGVKVGLYGGTPRRLEDLCRWAQTSFHGIDITYAFSPPFRELSEEEEAEVVKNVRSSGCEVLFVGIGCPKQERFMARHKGKLMIPMLGVGAAFDFLSGAKRQAPRWMMNCGLEWLFRLISEPRRLARRYLVYNSRFIWEMLKQAVRQ
jgi:N-acetylglucosaminyldiphosphoundecaprenol N-acetyl-beta-D-mannosaminyltransferase